MPKLSPRLTAWIAIIALNAPLLAQEEAAPRDASPHTAERQQQAAQSLALDDPTAFEQARRGFMASLDAVQIPRDDGQGMAYDLTGLDFLKGEAPPTVHPSLWRQSQLNALHHGLFEVVEGVYQVRSFDLANMTLIRGDSGWIVIDPLTTLETARAALELADRELGSRPIRAVIVTHPHADHFGGLGIVSREQIARGDVRLIAPAGLVAEALSENVLLGNAMVRRAGLMFGTDLPRSPKGFVGAGLAADLATGSAALLPVTDPITEDVTELTVDGIPLVFQNAPGAEAPVEIVVHLPRQKALCMAEITSHTLHNVYTPRGAKTRDAALWSKHIQTSIDLFAAKSDVLFGSHHWPIWGREQLIDFLEKQRDLYKFLHDQTVRLANHGLPPDEIAERIVLPESLAREFYNRGYYGTVSHNVRAIYYGYLGFFDGHPARLHPLPPNEESQRYVEYMGGAASVLEKARRSFAEGDYRWVATVLDHLVLAEPGHDAARELLAQTLEQLGYQAESAPWRNIYLSGAQELRQGPPTRPTADLRGLLLAAQIDRVFDALAVRLDPSKAGERTATIRFRFTDLEQTHRLEVRRGVLHAFKESSDGAGPDAQVSLTLTSLDFKRLLIGQATPQSLLANGQLQLTGDPATWLEIVSWLDVFDPLFPILPPRP